MEPPPAPVVLTAGVRDVPGRTRPPPLESEPAKRITGAADGAEAKPRAPPLASPIDRRRQLQIQHTSVKLDDLYAAPPLEQDEELLRAEADASAAASQRTEYVWLAICFFGIMGSFVCYGLLLEYATSGGKTLHELSFVFVTSLLYAATASLGRYARGEKPSTIPPAQFAVLGMTSMGSTFCSVKALRYVIYPIQVSLPFHCPRVLSFIVAPLFCRKKQAIDVDPTKMSKSQRNYTNNQLSETHPGSGQELQASTRHAHGGTHGEALHGPQVRQSNTYRGWSGPVHGGRG